MEEHFKVQNGFTLLEVIAVLAILGVLSVIAVNRWTSLDAEVFAGADVLKTHLRYAQAQAMNNDPNVSDNTIMGITYNATSKQYWLFSGINTSNIQILPDDMTYTTSTRTIDVSAKKIKLDAAFTIYFDHRGIPYSAYTSSAVNTPLSSAQSIVVSGMSGTQQIVVTITPQTGYIP